MTDDDRPLCKCHGVPQVWQQDPRKPPGGYWRCRIKQRENAARYDAANREKKRAYSRIWWHRADGGYIQKRKRELAAQRGRILNELGRLADAKSRLT